MAGLVHCSQVCEVVRATLRLGHDVIDFVGAGLPADGADAAIAAHDLASHSSPLRSVSALGCAMGWVAV